MAAYSRKYMREWVAAKLGRLTRISIAPDDGDDTLVEAPDLGDFVGDPEQFMDASLMLDLNTSPMAEWRRIESVNAAMDSISINRAFTDLPDAGCNALVYSLLKPTDYNDAINEALTPLYFPDRTTIETEATEREYTLPTWISSKAQVLGVRYRSVANGREEALPRFRLQESLQSGVKLVLMDAPWSPTQYDIIVEATRHHGRIDQDDYGTTCAEGLWQCAIEVAVIHKVLKKYGDRFKRQFMQDLMIAERSLAEAKARLLPVINATEYSQDDDWMGPDIDDFFLHSGWV